MYEYLDEDSKKEYDNFNGFIWGLNVKLTVGKDSYIWHYADDKIRKENQEWDFDVFCDEKKIDKTKIKLPPKTQDEK